jgi:hypothetical protein
MDDGAADHGKNRLCTLERLGGAADEEEELGGGGVMAPASDRRVDQLGVYRKRGFR